MFGSCSRFVIVEQLLLKPQVRDQVQTLLLEQRMSFIPDDFLPEHFRHLPTYLVEALPLVERDDFAHGLGNLVLQLQRQVLFHPVFHACDVVQSCLLGDCQFAEAICYFFELFIEGSYIDFEPIQRKGPVIQLRNCTLSLKHPVAKPLRFTVQTLMFRYEFVQPLIVKINYLLVRFKVLQSFSLILSQGVHRLFLDFCKVLTKVLNFFRANLHILAHLHRQINLRVLQKQPFPSITIKPLQSLKQF